MIGGCDICERVNVEVKNGKILDTYSMRKLDGFYRACLKCVTKIERMRKQLERGVPGARGPGIGFAKERRYEMLGDEINRAMMRKRATKPAWKRKLWF
jgi:hypothetical protein